MNISKTLIQANIPKYCELFNDDYEILTACVSTRSTVEVRCVLYTVPSRLIGRQLELHLYHDRILGYLGNQQVVELPRLRVTDPDQRPTVYTQVQIDWV